jgi:hypothetical protein
MAAFFPVIVAAPGFIQMPYFGISFSSKKIAHLRPLNGILGTTF